MADYKLQCLRMTGCYLEVVAQENLGPMFELWSEEPDLARGMIVMVVVMIPASRHHGQE